MAKRTQKEKDEMAWVILSSGAILVAVMFGVLNIWQANEITALKEQNAILQAELLRAQ